MSEKYTQNKDLIGKIFEHKWTDGKYKGVVYQVEFLSENELRWKGIEGFPKGKSDTEKYKITKIDKDIYQFSWLADDGLSVTIIYDFHNMTASAVVSSEEEKNVLRGTLRIIKNG